jgi:hypothetical protein
MAGKPCSVRVCLAWGRESHPKSPRESHPKSSASVIPSPRESHPKSKRAAASLIPSGRESHPKSSGGESWRFAIARTCVGVRSLSITTSSPLATGLKL